MQVPERTVNRWVNDESLPAQRVGGQYRFNRSDLFEWASLKKLPLPADLLIEHGEGGGGPDGLAAALAAGGVLCQTPGVDRETALAAVVERLRLPDGFDRKRLLELFLIRESIASTAVGDGIAIPHPRYPVVLPVPIATATICFLKQPIDFGAADGAPVDTLFVLVSPTVRSHLKLLSQLASALRDESFRQAVRRKAPANEVLDAALRWQKAREASQVNGASHLQESH
jgi:PTS system nitrogen regulatory IIA component